MVRLWQMPYLDAELLIVADTQEAARAKAAAWLAEQHPDSKREWPELDKIEEAEEPFQASPPGYSW